jgi:hypothetical protein
MDGFRLFARITKIDAVQRLVYGVAASEAADKAGERFDYDSSAPEFKRWSAEIEKGSQGKSLGNVRIMHQPVVGGILTRLDCDDAAKAVKVCAKVVSDEAWRLVDAGALTGFSIGGRYARRWTDPQDPQVHRYTAIPSEISLVDNPCNPDCFFEMVKLDGVIEKRPFRPGQEPTLHQGGDDPRIKSGEGAKPYGDVAYADPGWQKDGKKRYPIDTEAHIRAAWSYIHKPKNAKLYTEEQIDKIKARIVAAWKDKIDPKGPKGDGPPTADDSKKAATGLMAKHLSDIGDVACTILDLRRLKERLEMEAAIEGDASEPVEGPHLAKVQALIEALCPFLEALVAEEMQEIIDGDEAPDPVSDEPLARGLDPRDAASFTMPQIFLALPPGSLKKRVADLLSKRGIRPVGEARDHRVGADAAAAGDLSKLAADFAGLTQTVGMLSERVQKGDEAIGALTTERDELKTRLAKIEAEPLPPKTVKLPPGITAVEKTVGGNTVGGDLVAELQKLSAEEIQLLLIKAARRNPMRPAFAGPSRDQ